MCDEIFGATWSGLTKFKVSIVCGSNLYHKFIVKFGYTPDIIAMILFFNVWISLSEIFVQFMYGETSCNFDCLFINILN